MCRQALLCSKQKWRCVLRWQGRIYGGEQFASLIITWTYFNVEDVNFVLPTCLKPLPDWGDRQGVIPGVSCYLANLRTLTQTWRKRNLRKDRKPAFTEKFTQHDGADLPIRCITNPASRGHCLYRLILNRLVPCSGRS